MKTASMFISLCSIQWLQPKNLLELHDLLGDLYSGVGVSAADLSLLSSEWALLKVFEMQFQVLTRGG